MAEIRFTVTDDEHKAIKKNAEMLGYRNVTDYVRKVAQNPNIINFDYSAIEEHTKQVGQIVNSVNQLVFTIEVNNDYQPKEIEGIRDYVREIMKTENKLLREVRKQWERSVKGD